MIVNFRCLVRPYRRVLANLAISLVLSLIGVAAMSAPPMPSNSTLTEREVPAAPEATSETDTTSESCKIVRSMGLSGAYLQKTIAYQTKANSLTRRTGWVIKIRQEGCHLEITSFKETLPRELSFLTSLNETEKSVWEFDLSGKEKTIIADKDAKNLLSEFLGSKILTDERSVTDGRQASYNVKNLNLSTVVKDPRTIELLAAFDFEEIQRDHRGKYLPLLILHLEVSSAIEIDMNHELVVGEGRYQRRSYSGVLKLKEPYFEIRHLSSDRAIKWSLLDLGTSQSILNRGLDKARAMIERMFNALYPGESYVFYKKASNQ